MGRLIFEWLLAPILKKPVLTGELVGKDVSYPYKIGDKLTRFANGGPFSSFRGIDIQLPKELPHIYINTMNDSKFIDSRYSIDASQKIELEGDFPDTFDVYVPKGYSTQALSILSPDVMQSIMEYSQYFDIEIYGSHLRVICHRNVLSSDDVQAQLIEVSQKLLSEIHHRLKSWSLIDSRDAHNANLVVAHSQLVKISGRQFRLTTIGTLAVTVFYAIVSFIAAFSSYSSKQPDYETISLLVVGFIFFPCSFLFIRYLEHRMKFNSRS